eukprot:739950-Amorphochlora_amoeboformis.AAC.1
MASSPILGLELELGLRVKSRNGVEVRVKNGLIWRKTINTNNMGGRRSKSRYWRSLRFFEIIQ